MFVPPTRPDTALVSLSRGSVGCSIALLSIALGTAPWDCSLWLPSITLGGTTPRHNASRPLPVRRLAGARRSWPHCGECPRECITHFASRAPRTGVARIMASTRFCACAVGQPRCRVRTPSQHSSFRRLAGPLAGVSSIAAVVRAFCGPIRTCGLVDGTKNGNTTIKVIEQVQLGYCRGCGIALAFGPKYPNSPIAHCT